MNLGIIEEGINVLASDKHVWLTMLGYSTWKSLGWNAIMYIACMSNIDEEQYEAAKVDGASRMQRILLHYHSGPDVYIFCIASAVNRQPD